jgi:aminoglycoside phosphotransferase (APT) family kinase protein
MDSRTKLRVTREQIDALVRRALGTGVTVSSVRELTDGMFNAAYLVELGGGHPAAVLKVAPPPDVPLLTYEQGIMQTEVEFYERVGRETTCPVPRVMARDFTRTIVPADCFFMERLRGSPLNKVKGKLSKKELAEVKGELGSIAARLHAIRGDFFGYPRPEARTQAPTWRESFLKMVSRIVEDAARFSVRLPGRAGEMLGLFESRAGALEEVKVPVLTHFDLWEGNVFVHRVDGAAHVEAIIDGERAFWGDPHAELVSVALFGEIQDEIAFLRGYQRESGRPFAFTEALRTRLTMYRAYLYLLMVVEGAPRGYSGLRHALHRAYFRHKLKAELRKLRTVASTLARA